MRSTAIDKLTQVRDYLLQTCTNILTGKISGGDLLPDDLVDLKDHIGHLCLTDEEFLSLTEEDLHNFGMIKCEEGHGYRGPDWVWLVAPVKFSNSNVIKKRNAISQLPLPKGRGL